MRWKEIRRLFPRFTRSRYIPDNVKYVVLLVLVILLPAFAAGDAGIAPPYFCKYVCPAGTPAPAGQTFLHMPHRMHSGLLIFFVTSTFIGQARSQDKTNAAQAVERFIALIGQLLELATMDTLAYIRHSQNVMDTKAAEELAYYYSGFPRPALGPARPSAPGTYWCN